MAESSMDLAARTVAGLVGRLGVREVVLAPGSRSGPLALTLIAAEREGRLRLHMRVDEREAGFLALGLAKATGVPVAVVTTSGTAVANLHPAMLEAFHTDTPVIAVTADRPARLRGTGASQTTDQRGIFSQISTMSDIGQISVPQGPAHLNVEFDEPLIDTRVRDLGQCGANDSTQSRVEDHEPLTAQPQAGLRTIVIAGDGPAGIEDSVLSQGQWPIVAEPTSDLRTHPQALRTGRFLAEVPSLTDDIEQIICVGHPTLARSTTTLLARRDIPILCVGDQSNFPVRAGTNVTFVDQIRSAPPVPGWLRGWQDADQRAAEAIPGDDRWAIAATAWEATASHGLLVVGASNPIRDLDVAADCRAADRRVIANRGLAGIDGFISTAMGAALALPDRRAIALCGDLTFIHGSNALAVGPGEPCPDLTVIVVNDDGGGIFHTLEQGDEAYSRDFERVYGTPTGTQLGFLCAAHGVTHEAVKPRQLAERLDEPHQRIRVIEIAVDRTDRRELWQDAMHKVTAMF